jgi:hypothetical protein
MQMYSKYCNNFAKLNSKLLYVFDDVEKINKNKKTININ